MNKFESDNDFSFGQRFVEDWLFEMPRRTGKSEDVFPELLMMLTANKQIGLEVENFGNSDHDFIMKIDDSQIIVWREIQDTPEFIIDLKKFNNGYAVNYVGKLKGSNVDAAVMYDKLAKTFKRVIFSGDTISVQGANVWKKLIDTGHRINVYDTNTSTNTPITSSADIDKIEYDNNHTRFVLTDSIRESAVVSHKFETLRIQSICFGTTPNELVREWRTKT